MVDSGVPDGYVSESKKQAWKAFISHSCDLLRVNRNEGMIVQNGKEAWMDPSDRSKPKKMRLIEE